MKRAILAFVALLALVTSLSRAEDLRKLALDDVSSISPKIEADTEVKVEGRSSVRITAQWPTTVYLGEIVDLDVENAELIYSAKVKTALDGSAFLEMWAHVGGGQYFSRGTHDHVGGKSEWKTIRTPFLFQQGQKPDKLTLNLVIDGTGTVWVDDIVLSMERLK